MNTTIQSKIYWKDYPEGCVLNEGDHFETDTGSILYWHSYEATEAQTYLKKASEIAENAAKGL